MNMIKKIEPIPDDVKAKHHIASESRINWESRFTVNDSESPLAEQ